MSNSSSCQVIPESTDVSAAWSAILLTRSRQDALRMRASFGSSMNPPTKKTLSRPELCASAARQVTTRIHGSLSFELEVALDCASSATKEGTVRMFRERGCQQHLCRA